MTTRMNRYRRQRKTKKLAIAGALVAGLVGLGALPIYHNGVNVVQALEGYTKTHFASKATLEAQANIRQAQEEARAAVRSEWTPRTVEAVKAEIKRQEEAGYQAYVIQWGDTLGAIAMATGQSVEDLVEKNQIVGDKLFTGDLLDGVLGKTVEHTAAVNSPVSAQPVGPSTQPSALRQEVRTPKRDADTTRPAQSQPAESVKPSEDVKPSESATPQESTKPSESATEVSAEEVKPVESNASEESKPSESSEPLASEESSKPEESTPAEESKPEESKPTESSVSEESKPTESSESSESVAPEESSKPEESKPEESTPTEESKADEEASEPEQPFEPMAWEFTGKSRGRLGEFEDPRHFATEDEALNYGYSMMAQTGTRSVEEAAANVQRATGGGQFVNGAYSRGFEATQGMNDPTWTVFHRMRMTDYLNPTTAP